MNKNTMLGDIQYVRSFCERYPELLRVLLLRIGWTVRELYRIAGLVLADKKQIITELCQNIPFQNVENIVCGLSDSHRCGKSVAKGIRRPYFLAMEKRIVGISKFSALCKVIPDEKYARVYSMLCRKMFWYTDNLLQESSHEQKAAGAFIGEGSVMRAYLLLWKLTHDSEFLEYAKKHEKIVEQYSSGQNEADLSNGDAGLITVYIEMYECTKQEKYLEKAVQIGEKLWKRAEKADVGYGWTIKGENVPLAGMAHGNSGGIYAYALLLEHTRDKKYVLWIRELLKYEDSLYSADAKNWKDLRGKNGEGKEEQSAVAWCHGAPGILLSRLKLYSMNEFSQDTDVKRDKILIIGLLFVLVGGTIAAVKTLGSINSTPPAEEEPWWGEGGSAFITESETKVKDPALIDDVDEEERYLPLAVNPFATEEKSGYYETPEVIMGSGAIVVFTKPDGTGWDLEEGQTLTFEAEQYPLETTKTRNKGREIVFGYILDVCVLGRNKVQFCYVLNCIIWAKRPKNDIKNVDYIQKMGCTYKK